MSSSTGWAALKIQTCASICHTGTLWHHRATQVNFGSATPQLLHQWERTQDELHQRQWNHTQKMVQLKLESAQAVSPSHKPVPRLPRKGSILPQSCPLQQVWAWHIIHAATVSDHGFVLFYRQNMSKLCPKPKKQAHQTLGSDTSIRHLEVDLQENSQSSLICL